MIFILDEAIDFINEREKPLAAYCFTTDKKEAGLTTTHRIYANFTNFMLIQYSISVCSILLWNCFGWKNVRGNQVERYLESLFHKLHLAVLQSMI